ncbi:MAG: CAP domain-containing protein [Candidatus Pacebacteria bacterium]|nr:CAP domain-containing protein [Candidatus Paceibacterota bacterium]
MTSWLKKIFIPNVANENCPYILRSESTKNIIAIVIFLEIFTFLIPVFTHLNMSGNMATVLPGILADLTNQERQDQNLPALIVSPLLNEAAQMKANDMAENSYFAHTSPDGKTPWYWLTQVGYNYQYAGENLAINFSDSQDVANAWMASPAHRANIVKGNYTEVGTGVATGVYQGQETTFVVQDYANPLPPVVAETTPAPIKTGTKTTSNVVVKPATNVLGAETLSTPTIVVISVSNPTFWQKLIASPRNTTNIILDTFFLLVLISLILYFFTKIRNHNFGLITNGLMSLVVIGAIFSFNYYASYHNMVITQSLDYRSVAVSSL